LPIFCFDKARGIARLRGRVEFKQIRSELDSRRRELDRARNEIEELRDELKSKRQEARQIRKVQRTSKDEAERSEYRNRESSVQPEIVQLKRGLRAAKERRAGSTLSAQSASRAADGTGALPDFFIIGAKKGGTTFLYHLLTQHPLVEHAAAKEVHFFDAFFDEGIEWYRRCFPTPRWKDGRRTITGEATPAYLSYPVSPSGWRKSFRKRG
jgi:hypothetical protein